MVSIPLYYANATRWRARKALRLTLAAMALLVAVPVSGLDAPSGRVILDIEGAIEQTNADGSARFDHAMLDALPQHQIRTETPWTEGEQEFSGPLLRDVLESVRAKGSRLKAVALNDYHIEIPIDDAKEHEVILATRLNGKRLRVRTKGPLWVIYPWGTHPELRTDTFFQRSIWQLQRLVVD